MVSGSQKQEEERFSGDCWSRLFGHGWASNDDRRAFKGWAVQPSGKWNLLVGKQKYFVPPSWNRQSAKNNWNPSQGPVSNNSYASLQGTMSYDAIEMKSCTPEKGNQSHADGVRTPTQRNLRNMLCSNVMPTMPTAPKFLNSCPRWTHPAPRVRSSPTWKGQE